MVWTMSQQWFCVQSWYETRLILDWLGAIQAHGNLSEWEGLRTFLPEQMKHVLADLSGSHAKMYLEVVKSLHGLQQSSSYRERSQLQEFMT